MSFFDNSHVTDVGMEGTLGRTVSTPQMISQLFTQQFRVDAPMALEEELRNRWLQSLRLANIARTGSTYEDSADPVADPQAYRAMAQYVSGQNVDMPDARKPLFGERDYDPTRRIWGMITADAAIRELNDPNIKTFSQILEEVSAMQQEVEAETASMSERASTFGNVVGMLGSMAGSFTTRDPLNIITAPVGAGRHIATKIATDMGIAAGVTGITEFSDVAPSREIVGLPERDPFYNIVAAGLGAGVIRGGLEALGFGARRIGERFSVKDIDFDLRDQQLQQMFEANSTSPTARAGAQALDDMIFLEKNNPYGGGQSANERFIAELRQVQLTMDGAPMTAVGRVLPPVPFEYIQKEADFVLVKEQKPLVYVRMEVAQSKVTDLTRQIDEAVSRQGIDLIRAVRQVDEDAAGKLEQLSVRVNDETLPEAARVAADMEGQAIIQRIGVERISKAADAADLRTKFEVRNLRASRRAANKQYREAYRAVEAEAERIRQKEATAQNAAQRQAANVFMPANEGRVFLGPILSHNYVEARVAGIEKYSETIDDRAVGMFARETVGEAEEAVEREVWQREEGIDIGLEKPVDPNFRFIDDDGDISVADAMRDLQDDVDLDEAMRICLR